MLARRIARDTKERGRSVEGVLEQYVFSGGPVKGVIHVSQGTFAMSSHPTIISFFPVLDMPIS
jgi:Phosphoribulokinase / Uridine kinase family